MKRVIMYSGGWDSYCTSLIFPDAKKVYVNLHTPYSEAEMRALPAGVEVQDLDLQRYALSDGVHVAQRNAILALIGAASIMPEAERKNDMKVEVYIIGVKEDLNITAPDKSPEYFALLSKLASAFVDKEGRQWDIQVKGFFKYGKIDLWEMAGKPDMRNIVSCYTSENCGKCLACKRRLLYLDYLYPNEYDIDRKAYIKELQAEQWIIDERIIERAMK